MAGNDPERLIEPEPRETEVDLALGVPLAPPAVEPEPACAEASPLVDGESIGDGPSVGVHEPATGAPLGRVRLAGAAEVEAAVQAAARTLPVWRQTPFAQRGAALRALAARIREQAVAIAELIAREQGKPVIEAIDLEVLPVLDHLDFMIAHAERYHAGLMVEPRHPFYAHKRAHYLYDAVGVLALVTPAPLPFVVPMIQVAAAVAMGNAVVLKPSEHAALTGAMVGRLCSEAGLPPGLVNVLPATARETLQLVAHPRVDKVFFTGTLDVGQTIMATAGCAPRPVVLSLGDKHATIVAGDADVDRAAKGIVWGALANAGQHCGAVERVFVEESIASRLLPAIQRELDGVTVGNPLVKGVDMGPLHRAASREHVHTHVAEAVARGARLVRGGAIPEGPGSFYPPTLLLDPPLDSRVMREETGGPVIPIVTVDNLERALLLAADSDYALSASGWTASEERAERMMDALPVGVVTVNDVLYSFGEPAATWSGFKRSGLGQNHGRPGLREMSRQRFASFDAGPAEGPLFSYPYDDAAFKVTRAALDYLHGPTALRGWRGLLQLLRSRRFRTRVPVRSMLSRQRKGKG